MPAARTKVAEELDNVQTVSILGHPLINFSNFTVQCSVVVGKLSHVSLLNADVVAKPSTVERIVKVPLGVKGTGFGAVPRTLTTMGTITITTESVGMLLGRSGMVGHLR
jgi:hypothetical protein